jgi:hypothetical protein
MNNLEKEFIPYQEAFELKQLGFNEPCFAFYQTECNEDSPIMVDDDKQYLISGFRTCRNSEMANHYISAPTYSQVFRWFREKCGLYSRTYIIKPFQDDEKEYPEEVWIGQICQSDLKQCVNTDNGLAINHFYTCEEAEIACLKAMINRVNGGNKMKLYTEEEIIRAIELSDGRSIDEVLAGLKSIELPSDEEIIDRALEVGYTNTLFSDGAKWMLDKIKGGNK